mgnify:CR=1 FL=1
MDQKKEYALKKHAEWKGKLSVECKCPITNKEALAVAYTPGVAEPCLEIQKDEHLAYTYTGKGNTVAVITDGTAVLGLGDIGPYPRPSAVSISRISARPAVLRSKNA